MSAQVRRLRWFLTAALVCQIVLTAWAFDVSALFGGSDDGDFAQVQVAPNGGPIDIERGQAIAWQHVQPWRGDARLVAAVMRLEWPDDAGGSDQIVLPEGGWLVFTYAAGDRTLSIYLDRRTGIYITSAESDFGDERVPTVDLSAYARDSTTAALTAEVLHGAGYRAACPSTRSVAIVTPSRIAGPDGAPTPIWTVTYADSRTPGSFDVVVQLDATNGNVIASEVVDRPCDG